MFSTILLPLASYPPDPATLAQLKNLVCVPDGRVVLLRLNSDQARVNVEFELLLRLRDVAGVPLNRWGAHKRKRTEQVAR